ncbi:YfcC family protein [Capnocytophaga catalasegens]|uniref:C4-dicarboxylate transporter n=1 Tax=Capnocytophaga catalasegens TaxID=1004260 RepID=A0AAV5AXQ3_9FLAO|nr:YfcC family protein [Capnocytophaga catalasegens]GIZ15776.1 C4-dicarboxylate transporter [Capnocytophaga catalasegens]GJM49788.1 C4-dicarboxylate transporter [Capnocytophaga catalasegens]GJM52953.1 C4-dicarboxylate transporter [Capnocytophaga catalasegens]
MKRVLKFPTPYTVLMIVIVFAALLTYLLPSGAYDTLTYDSTQDVFVLKSKETTQTLPATQQVLDEKSIAIDISKFKEGKIKKPVSIPNTYKESESQPQGIKEILFAPIKGIYETIDIILFVLILGGFIGVFNNSGTLNEGVGYLSYRLKGREGILIIIVCTLIALGGTSFGLAEETLAFYPILIPVFLAAGYDLMVPLAVIYLGSSVGSMAATINPFSVIIASDAAGVDWTTGATTRVIMLVTSLVITIVYIIRYAEKVKKNPQLSIAYGTPLPESLSIEKAAPVEKLKLSSKLLLTVFALSFLIMIVGVARWGWWFEEMTALFLVASVCIALFQRMGEEQFITDFIAGAKDLLGVAFIIGIARGVTFILNDGQISDTILHYSTNLVGGMSPVLFLPVLMCVFGILTLFISSSSGMAVVTMPIMGSLATVVGIEGQNVVNAYLFGMGLMSFITPIGLILPSLAMVNISYNQWLKFVMPLLIILTLLSVGMLWVGYYF